MTTLGPIYAVLVIAVLLLPWLAQVAPARQATFAPRPWLAILLLGCGLLTTTARSTNTFYLVAPLILAGLGLGLWELLGALAAILLLVPLAWWLGETGLAQSQQIVAALACGIVALWARRAKLLATQGPPSSIPIAKSDVAITLGLSALALGWGLLTGAMNDPASTFMAWHHWGAYLSPVDTLLTGGVPFRDFPVQYGMGPTLLLAAICGSDCWSGLYAATVGLNAIYLAALGWCVLLLMRGTDVASKALALAAMACAVLLWTGYPIGWGTMMMTPSVAGMRFLPMVLLLACILTIEASQEPAKRGPLLWCGHALWFLGLVWAPEAAFFASLIWWPWLAMRDAAGRDGSKARWQALVLGGMRGLAALVTGYAILALISRLTYGAWIMPGEFLLYLLYPPGVLQANPTGPAWFAAAVLLLGGVALWRLNFDPAGRRLYCCMLVLLAGLSYFLSRSHDNNICNLLAFLVLVLAAVRGFPQGSFATGFVRTALAGIVAMVALFQFHDWTVRAGAAEVAGLQVGGAAVIARFAQASGQPDLNVPADAVAALSDLRGQGAGTVLLFDCELVMPWASPGHAWTPVNNAANFVPLPPEVRRQYIRRGADVYRQSGWAVIANNDPDHWLDQFQSAYSVAGTRRYGSYTAYHFVPRNAP